MSMVCILSGSQCRQLKRVLEGCTYWQKAMKCRYLQRPRPHVWPLHSFPLPQWGLGGSDILGADLLAMMCWDRVQDFWNRMDSGAEPS